MAKRATKKEIIEGVTKAIEVSREAREYALAVSLLAPDLEAAIAKCIGIPNIGKEEFLIFADRAWDGVMSKFNAIRKVYIEGVSNGVTLKKKEKPVGLDKQES